jgi:hypothetical protein
MRIRSGIERNRTRVPESRTGARIRSAETPRSDPKGNIMKRFIAAISFAVLAGTVFAADHYSGPIGPSPLDRIPGMRDPLDVHDPLMDRPSGGASLPELPGGHDASKPFEPMQPRPLPGARGPLPGQPVFGAPPSYWERDPLYIAPPR